MRLIFVVLLALSFSANASDLAKEKRWADQVVDAIIDGDAVWLNNGETHFLGIYTEVAKNKDRAVILMHGTGVHPDWQQVIQPLRVGLTEHGWNTLSIQMPVLANDAEHLAYAPLYDEVAPRVNAAIKYLRANNIKNIVLLGHSKGSTMAAYYLATSKQAVDGFVAIGMSVSTKDSRMDSISHLKKIRLPVLDLYGKNDLENVVSSASARATAAKGSGNKKYTQRVITGNHFFDGNDDVLVKTVAGWLSTLSNL